MDADWGGVSPECALEGFGDAVVSPFQGLECFGLITRAFSPGYHVAGLQPFVGILLWRNSGSFRRIGNFSIARLGCIREFLAGQVEKTAGGYPFCEGLCVISDLADNKNGDYA
jgi:hypothetical protein